MSTKRNMTPQDPAVSHHITMVNAIATSSAIFIYCIDYTRTWKVNNSLDNNGGKRT